MRTHTGPRFIVSSEGLHYIGVSFVQEREHRLVKQLKALEEELNIKETTIRRMQKQMEAMHKQILDGQKALRNAERDFEKRMNAMGDRLVLVNPFTASCENAMTLSVPGVPASCEKFPHSSQLNF
jgi:uncharacterized protein HemX